MLAATKRAAGRLLGIRDVIADRDRLLAKRDSVSKHCAGGYIEFYRSHTTFNGFVYASGIQADGSPVVSPKCTYEGPYSE
jgi:hypothetical protein